jgi:hypothetical protein
MPAFLDSPLPHETKNQILDYLTSNDLMNRHLARVFENEANVRLFKILRVMRWSDRRQGVLQILQQTRLAANIETIYFESAPTTPLLAQLVAACGHRCPRCLILHLDRANISYFILGDLAFVNFMSRARKVEMVNRSYY